MTSQFTSSARVPTGNACRYLQQLCKHWQHNLEVEFTPEQGNIRFPRTARGADWPGDGVVHLTALDDGLECRVDATADGQLQGLKQALQRHLDRFAFREAPLQFDWTD